MTQNIRKLTKTFKGKKILVTGGTGSIGSEIVKQLLQYNPAQVRIFSRDESKHFFLSQDLEKIDQRQVLRYLIGDIRDKERLDFAMKDIDIVFHAAALKHVPYCEYNSFEAIKTNIYGTQNIVDLAIKHQPEKVVAISTDKAVNPNTIMGISKLMSERIVIATHNHMGDIRTQFSAVRFGNVLNSRGSILPTWKEQIKKGGPVTVTDKRMNRFFMSIPDAVSLVFEATQVMLGGEVIVLKMKEVNIYQLALKMIEKYGQGKKIAIKITGARNREKIREALYTEEERQTMIEKEDFFIILPNYQVFTQRKNLY